MEVCNAREASEYLNTDFNVGLKSPCERTASLMCDAWVPLKGPAGSAPNILSRITNLSESVQLGRRENRRY